MRVKLDLLLASLKNLSNRKLIIIGGVSVGLVLLLTSGILFATGSIHFPGNQPPTSKTQSSVETSSQLFNTNNSCQDNPHPSFTSDLTDTSKIRLINPMGLGEILPRFRTFLWIDTTKASSVPIYSPTDADLVEGVYKSIHGTTDYDFHFIASCQIWFLINHVSDPIDKIKKNFTTPPATDTRSDSVTKISPPIHFKAGELIGYTTGTGGANNFDFGAYDLTHTNQFANQARYNTDPYSKYLTAVCPYDFFSADKKAVYYNKFGEDVPVTGAGCLSITQDKAGTISGIWFGNSDITQANNLVISLMVGVYTDGAVRVTGPDTVKAIITPTNASFIDPTLVTSEHCYQLSGRQIYFKVASASSIEVYDGTGICGNTFPTSGFKTYYR